MKINGISINSELNNVKGLGLLDSPQKTETSFKNIFMEVIHNTNRLELESEKYGLKLATGQLENIHEAMIAAQKAEVSLQYMMQIRNKVLDAYREITRMQI